MENLEYSFWHIMLISTCLSFTYMHDMSDILYFNPNLSSPMYTDMSVCMRDRANIRSIFLVLFGQKCPCTIFTTFLIFFLLSFIYTGVALVHSIFHGLPSAIANR